VGELGQRHHDPADQRPRDVVLLDLGAGLAGDPLQLLAKLLLVLLALADRLDGDGLKVLFGEVGSTRPFAQNVAALREQIADGGSSTPKLLETRSRAGTTRSCRRRQRARVAEVAKGYIASGEWGLRNHTLGVLVGPRRPK
jgi:hypothetical protein